MVCLMVAQVDAECRLLGALISRQDAISAVQRIVGPNDFGDHFARRMFRTLIRGSGERMRFTDLPYNTWPHRLPERQKTALIDGLEGFKCMPIREYAEMVFAAAELRREIQAAASWMREQAALEQSSLWRTYQQAGNRMLELAKNTKRLAYKRKWSGPHIRLRLRMYADRLEEYVQDSRLEPWELQLFAGRLFEDGL